MLIRPAAETDADAVAAVQLGARRSAAMPPGIHSARDVRRWLGRRLRTDDVWVAEVEGEVVGYARMTPAWLDDLYVLPGHAGQGIGSALLDVAKTRLPDGFCLWVFEMNAPARRFYAQHGLIELERTDGSANEERRPDIRVAWPGTEPLRFLRGLIEEVDAQLADLEARRTALARAVEELAPGAGAEI